MGVEWRQGAWYLRLKHADGVWRYDRTDAPTRKEAELLYAEELARLERVRRGLQALDLNPKRWTLWQLLDWWLGRYGVKLASHSRATSALTVHVKEHRLASMPIDRVTPGMLQAMLHDLPSEPVRRIVRGYISVAFTRAGEEDLFFGNNPVAKTRRAKDANLRDEFLELEEIAALLAFMRTLATDKDKRTAEPAHLRALVYALALFTGMRRGEIYALRWRDVDMKRGRITIRRSNARDTTKSGKPRVIDIAAPLRAWLEGREGKPNDLVCPGRDGDLRSSDSKAAARLRNDLELAGHPRSTFRFHDLRHTFASWWLMKGGTLEALQEALGHSSIDITRRRYGHLSRSFVSAQWARFNLDVDAPAAVVDLASRKAQ